MRFYWNRTLQNPLLSVPTASWFAKQRPGFGKINYDKRKEFWKVLPRTERAGLGITDNNETGHCVDIVDCCKCLPTSLETLECGMSIIHCEHSTMEWNAATMITKVLNLPDSSTFQFITTLALEPTGTPSPLLPKLIESLTTKSGIHLISMDMVTQVPKSDSDPEMMPVTPTCKTPEPGQSPEEPVTPPLSWKKTLLATYFREQGESSPPLNHSISSPSPPSPVPGLSTASASVPIPNQEELLQRLYEVEKEKHDCVAEFRLKYNDYLSTRSAQVQVCRDFLNVLWDFETLNMLQDLDMGNEPSGPEVGDGKSHYNLPSELKQFGEFVRNVLGYLESNNHCPEPKTVKQIREAARWVENDMMMRSMLGTPDEATLKKIQDWAFKENFAVKQEQEP